MLFLSFVVFSLTLSTSLAFFGFDFRFDSNDLPPKTVSELDVNAYLGRWYQTFSSFLANQTFEKNGYCVTADYVGVSETEFNITNAQNLGSPTGKLNEIKGKGVLPNPEEPGKWLVTFTDEKTHKRQQYSGSPYWIINLGPKNPTTEQYDYAVISAPLGTSLFILARNVSDFRSTYQQQLLADLKEQGFATPFNKPLETYQGPDCAYRPADTEATTNKEMENNRDQGTEEKFVRAVNK
jgi:lipocalin